MSTIANKTPQSGTFFSRLLNNQQRFFVLHIEFLTSVNQLKYYSSEILY
jgi:hypothetical protein